MPEKRRAMTPESVKSKNLSLDMNKFRQIEIEAPIKRFKNKRVLVIDDDIYSVQILLHVLQQFGCNVQVSQNAINAVDRLVKDDFDLIILDWMMPKLNGNETLLAAQQLIGGVDEYGPLGRHTPFIVYSGLPKDRLDVPYCSHFDYLKHLQKPQRYANLKREIFSLLYSL